MKAKDKQERERRRQGGKEGEGKEEDRERKKGGGRGGDERREWKDRIPNGSISQECHLGPPHVWQEPKYLGHPLLLHIIRELDLRAGKQSKVVAQADAHVGHLCRKM